MSHVLLWANINYYGDVNGNVVLVLWEDMRLLCGLDEREFDDYRTVDLEKYNMIHKTATIVFVCTRYYEMKYT